MAKRRLLLITRYPHSKTRSSEAKVLEARALLRSAAKCTRHKLRRGLTATRCFDGHSEVTSTLIAGLSAVGLRYDYNSIKAPFSYNAAGILSGGSFLRQTVMTVVDAGATNVHVGPNAFIDPQPYRSLIEEARISSLIVPAGWVRDFYLKQLPEFRGRISLWHAAVDHTLWSPTRARHELENECLVYVKGNHWPLLRDVLDLVRNLGFAPTVLIYGHHRTAAYRRILRRVQFVVVLGGSESQGIAQFEAWSTDTPTLVFSNLGTQQAAQRISGGESNNLSAATASSPFLTDATGYFWDSLTVLQQLIRREIWRTSQPRKWIQENADPRMQAEKYLELLNL